MPTPPIPSPASAASGGALAGLRVLDLSRVLAGPYCAQMLADHGADVIKVEPPAGDETRGWGPPFVAPDTSAYYRNLNRAKKNIVVDLSAPEGRDILDALLRDTDVLVENFKAGTLAKWGYADEDLRQRHPALIHCRITGFGAEGPLGGQPGYDAVLQAYGGLMSVNGEQDGPPLRVGVPVVDQVTGILAFSGILLALHERHRSGLGQLVDCTLLDTAVSLLHPHSAAYLADGTVPRRTGSAHPSIAPYDSFAAADGPVFVAVGNDRQFGALADALGLPGLVDDPRFRANADRVRHQGDLRAALAEAIAGHTRAELTARLTARGIPASPVHDVAEALTASQVRHRGLVVESDGYRGLASPVSLSRTPARVRPEVRGAGADTRDVLAAAGLDEEFIGTAAERGVVRLAEPSAGGDDG
ncbi:CaiB/BaiF CoA transferase family protein [Streptomyces sp. NRRL S-1521]|uniref:CaiB/BaiF CoA transferase family protein n=1 Tax=Streptomyces sp. NRRL S-1521 TaxID=1609100 RepID=UPI0007462DFA|nr:CoA transferase [Streptomyces sp. NRRL S-1521]KUL54148.1 carnitine dehydratase [Streptomyces sp. NRRL S-1521]